MEPFLTQHTGWGVRALQDIKKGSFIIEYTGAATPAAILCGVVDCGSSRGRWMPNEAGSALSTASCEADACLPALSHAGAGLRMHRVCC